MMKKTRRHEGKDGWTKTLCSWSKTSWAWEREEGCTCCSCTPPKDAEERLKAVRKRLAEAMLDFEGGSFIMGKISASKAL
jgi:hypothetical protein